MSMEWLAPPSLIEAEMATLGSVIVDRNLFPIVAHYVSAPDYYAHVHGTIFASMAALHDAGKPCDLITLAEDLRNRKRLDEVGGVSYLRSLIDIVPSASSAEYYAKIVREHAVRFRLFKTAHEIMRLAKTGHDVSSDIADAEKSLLSAVGTFGVPETGGHIGDILRDVWREIDAASRGEIRSQKTPWPTLDAMTGGFFGGEMPIWFGRPKDGKSSAIVQLAEFVAENYGPVVIFALEMGENSVARRLLAKHSGVSARAIRSGLLKPTDYDRLGDAINSISDLPLYIYSSARSVSEMRRTLMVLRSKVPISAFVVDHIGFTSDVVESDETEHAALNKAYLRIINLAKEMNCVAHVVQHTNRQGYDREPTMKDIRGGGNAEGHAHTIICPYRPNVDEDPRNGKFLVLANREGATGAIEMTFDGPRNRWDEAKALRGAA